MSPRCPHLTGLAVTSRTTLNKHCPEPSVFSLTLKKLNSGVTHEVHWVEVVFVMLNKDPSFSGLIRFYFIKLLKMLGIVNY